MTTRPTMLTVREALDFLLGAARAASQMISYEIAMGLALVAVVLTFGTLDLQQIVRDQGKLMWGVLPAWGVFYQPLALLIFFVAGMADLTRVARLTRLRPPTSMRWSGNPACGTSRVSMPRLVPMNATSAL